MKAWFRGLLTAAAFVPGAAGAGALADIYRQAQASDAQLAAAQAAVRAGREAYPQARAAVLPQLTATASVSEIEREVTASPFSGQGGGGNQPSLPFKDRYRSEQFSIELRQPLFDWGIPAQLRQGRNQVTVAELDFKSAQTQLRARVMQAYIGFLNADAELAFAREEREAIAADLQRTKGRYEVGEVSVTALREAQAARDMAKTRIIEARTALDEARENLREITDHWYQSLPGIDGEIPLSPPDPNSAEAWVDIALKYNATYLSALQQTEIAEDEITQRQSGYLPDLDLVASYSDSDNTEFIFGQAANDTSIGLQATWQLFAGGRSHSEVREARANYDRSHAELERVRRETASSIRNAYRQVVSDGARVRALKQAVTSARAALESVQGEYEVGERTQADVLDARRDLYRALTNMANARYNFLSSVVTLKLVAGILSDDDLARLDARLAGAGAGNAVHGDRE